MRFVAMGNAKWFAGNSTFFGAHYLFFSFCPALKGRPNYQMHCTCVSLEPDDTVCAVVMLTTNSGNGA